MLAIECCEIDEPESCGISGSFIPVSLLCVQGALKKHMLHELSCSTSALIGWPEPEAAEFLGKVFMTCGILSKVRVGGLRGLIFTIQR